MFSPQILRARVKLALARFEMIPYIGTRPILDLTLVTGANSLYFQNLLQFLESFYKYENGRIIVYDLGLSPSENLILIERYPNLEIRKFDYSKYPDYFDINVDAGQYAWKPVIISEVLNEVKACICWMDVGNVIQNGLSDIRRILAKTGFYSPYSSGTVIEWTHINTIKHLRVKNNCFGKRNLAGGCVGLNYAFPDVRLLVNKWEKCALDKDCIAPEGSSRKNHRQDQAVLTVLAYQLNLVKKSPHLYHGFDVHQAVDKRFFIAVH